MSIKTNSRNRKANKARQNKKARYSRQKVMYANKGVQGVSGIDGGDNKKNKGVQGIKTGPIGAKQAKKPSITEDGIEFKWIDHSFTDNKSGKQFSSGYAAEIISGGGFVGYESLDEHRARKSAQQNKQQEPSREERKKARQRELEDLKKENKTGSFTTVDKKWEADSLGPSTAQEERLTHIKGVLKNEWGKVFKRVSDLQKKGDIEGVKRVLTYAGNKYLRICQEAYEHWGDGEAFSILNKYDLDKGGAEGFKDFLQKHLNSVYQKAKAPKVEKQEEVVEEEEQTTDDAPDVAKDFSDLNVQSDAKGYDVGGKQFSVDAPVLDDFNKDVLKKEEPKTEEKRVGSVPIGELKLDPERFQFKHDSKNDKGYNAARFQGAKFNPDLAGTILVWRDPEDGELYVVNGHHRYNMAKNSGYDGDISVQFSNAKTAREAKQHGAIQNIADGKGTGTDVAALVRDGLTKDKMLEEGVAPASSIMNRGLVLANLSPRLFKELENQQNLDEDTALVIAENLPNDEDRQIQLYERFLRKFYENGEEPKKDYVEALATSFNSVEGQSKGANLFGEEDVDYIKEVETRAKIIQEILGNLRKDKRVFGRINKKNSDALAEKDVLKGTLDADAAKGIKEVADKTIATIKEESKFKGPLNDILKESVKQYLSAHSDGERNEIIGRAVDKLKDYSAGLGRFTAGQEDSGGDDGVLEERQGEPNGKLVSEDAPRLFEESAESEGRLDSVSAGNGETVSGEQEEGNGSGRGLLEGGNTPGDEDGSGTGSGREEEASVDAPVLEEETASEEVAEEPKETPKSPFGDRLVIAGVPGVTKSESKEETKNAPVVEKPQPDYRGKGISGVDFSQKPSEDVRRKNPTGAKLSEEARTLLDGYFANAKNSLTSEAPSYFKTRVQDIEENTSPYVQKQRFNEIIRFLTGNGAADLDDKIQRFSPEDFTSDDPVFEQGNYNGAIVKARDIITDQEGFEGASINDILKKGSPEYNLVTLDPDIQKAWADARNLEEQRRLAVKKRDAALAGGYNRAKESQWKKETGKASGAATRALNKLAKLIAQKYGFFKKHGGLAEQYNEMIARARDVADTQKMTVSGDVDAQTKIDKLLKRYEDGLYTNFENEAVNSGEEYDPNIYTYSTGKVEKESPEEQAARKKKNLEGVQEEKKRLDKLIEQIKSIKAGRPQEEVAEEATSDAPVIGQPEEETAEETSVDESFGNSEQLTNEEADNGQEAPKNPLTPSKNEDIERFVQREDAIWSTNWYNDKEAGEILYRENQKLGDDIDNFYNSLSPEKQKAFFKEALDYAISSLEETIKTNPNLSDENNLANLKDERKKVDWILSHPEDYNILPKLNAFIGYASIARSSARKAQEEGVGQSASLEDAPVVNETTEEKVETAEEPQTAQEAPETAQDAPVVEETAIESESEEDATEGEIEPSSGVQENKPDGYYEIDEELARRAHDANSFRTFEKGRTTNEYRGMVNNARRIAEEQKKTVDPMYHDRIDALLGKYERTLANWFNKQSSIEASVPSIMVAGGGNFPVRRKEKQNQRRSAHYEEFDKIEEILRKIQGVGTAGISSDDQNAVAKLQKKYDDLKRQHDLSVRINKYFRKNNTVEGFPAENEDEQALVDFIVKENTGIWNRKGFNGIPPYQLTNETAELRRIQERINSLKRKGETNYGDGWKFDGGITKANKEDNRLQIFFDEIPDAETRAKLKSRGFKWSPKNKAWQRQLNNNSLWDARYLGFIPKKQESADKTEETIEATPEAEPTSEQADAPVIQEEPQATNSAVEEALELRDSEHHALSEETANKILAIADGEFKRGGVSELKEFMSGMGLDPIGDDADALRKQLKSHLGNIRLSRFKMNTDLSKSKYLGSLGEDEPTLDETIGANNDEGAEISNEGIDIEDEGLEIGDDAPVMDETEPVAQDDITMEPQLFGDERKRYEELKANKEPKPEPTSEDAPVVEEEAVTEEVEEKPAIEEQTTARKRKAKSYVRTDRQPVEVNSDTIKDSSYTSQLPSGYTAQYVNPDVITKLDDDTRLKPSQRKALKQFYQSAGFFDEKGKSTPLAEAYHNKETDDNARGIATSNVLHNNASAKWLVDNFHTIGGGKQIPESIIIEELKKQGLDDRQAKKTLNGLKNIFSKHEFVFPVSYDSKLKAFAQYTPVSDESRSSRTAAMLLDLYRERDNAKGYPQFNYRISDYIKNPNNVFYRYGMRDVNEIERWCYTVSVLAPELMKFLNTHDFEDIILPSPYKRTISELQDQLIKKGGMSKDEQEERERSIVDSQRYITLDEYRDIENDLLSGKKKFSDLTDQEKEEIINFREGRNYEQTMKRPRRSIKDRTQEEQDFMNSLPPHIDRMEESVRKWKEAQNAPKEEEPQTSEPESTPETEDAPVMEETSEEVSEQSPQEETLNKIVDDVFAATRPDDITSSSVVHMHDAEIQNLYDSMSPDEQKAFIRKTGERAAKEMEKALETAPDNLKSLIKGRVDTVRQQLGYLDERWNDPMHRSRMWDDIGYYIGQLADARRFSGMKEEDLRQDEPLHKDRIMAYNPKTKTFERSIFNDDAPVIDDSVEFEEEEPEQPEVADIITGETAKDFTKEEADAAKKEYDDYLSAPLSDEDREAMKKRLAESLGKKRPENSLHRYLERYADNVDDEDAANVLREVIEERFGKGEEQSREINPETGEIIEEQQDAPIVEEPKEPEQKDERYANDVQDLYSIYTNGRTNSQIEILDKISPMSDYWKLGMIDEARKRFDSLLADSDYSAAKKKKLAKRLDDITKLARDGKSSTNAALLEHFSNIAELEKAATPKETPKEERTPFSYTTDAITAVLPNKVSEVQRIISDYRKAIDGGKSSEDAEKEANSKIQDLLGMMFREFQSPDRFGDLKQNPKQVNLKADTKKVMRDKGFKQAYNEAVPKEYQDDEVKEQVAKYALYNRYARLNQALNLIYRDAENRSGMSPHEFASRYGVMPKSPYKIKDAERASIRMYYDGDDPQQVCDDIADRLRKKFDYNFDFREALKNIQYSRRSNDYDCSSDDAPVLVF